MKKFLQYLKFTWEYVKEEKVKLFTYIFLNIITIFISIFVPILGAKIIVYLTDNSFYQLLLLAFLLFIIEIVRNVINYVSRFCSQVIYREGFVKIQIALGQEIVKIENQCIDNNSSGVFIQRLTTDTSRLAEIFNILNTCISNIITNIGIFIAVFMIHKVVFLYLIIMVLVLYFIDKKRVHFINEKDHLFRKQQEKVSGFVGELVRGVRDIKMLNAEDSFIKELSSKVKRLNEDRYQMSKVDRDYSFLRDSFNDFFDFFMIVLLVSLIMHHELTVASALIVHNYMGYVTSIIYYMGMLMEKTKDFNLSASRVFSIIHGEEFPKEKFGSKHLDKVNGDFEFVDVSFSYDHDEKKALNHLSFQIHANETVAFVGKSGAGKSTIFSLLCKMYDIDKGKILIDGEDISSLDKESIRGNITIISQNPYIFNLSIRDNLRLVKENLTDEEMVEACKLACLDDFISQLPDGYATIVGEGGITLSGGERQRLAIARAFIQKTEIILFDEATSALDNETQASIQKAIDNMKKEYTILIIAHRLSTVVHSDRILFLNQGRIEAEGTHQQLLKKSKNYKELYEAELLS